MGPYSGSRCQASTQRNLSISVRPLRRLAGGVLVFGRGLLTHNTQYAFRPGIPQWEKGFDAWAAAAHVRFDVD